MSTWSATSLEYFKECLQFELSASTTTKCPCDESESDSMCTFLWKKTEEDNDALAPSRPKWINCNRELFSRGLAHKTGDMLMEEFFEYDFEIPEDKSSVEDLRNVELKSNIESSTNDDNNNKVYLEGPIVAKAQTNQYKKPQIIQKTVFTGYPTYVDHEAVIYLHDDEGKKYIDQINYNIESFLKSPEWKNHELNNCDKSAEDWKPGQACLARFHFDKKYYRAEILSILHSECIQVRFVDYGNVEECDYTGLLNICVYPKVPIQARKYKFYGIKPLDNASHYPTTVLDTMHKIIVEKICQIRVETKVGVFIFISIFRFNVANFYCIQPCLLLLFSMLVEETVSR